MRWNYSSIPKLQWLHNKFYVHTSRHWKQSCKRFAFLELQFVYYTIKLIIHTLTDIWFNSPYKSNVFEKATIELLTNHFVTHKSFVILKLDVVCVTDDLSTSPHWFSICFCCHWLYPFMFHEGSMIILTCYGLVKPHDVINNMRMGNKPLP